MLTVPEQPPALQIHHLGEYRAQLRQRSERNGDVRHRLEIEHRGESIRLLQRRDCGRRAGDESPRQVGVEVAPATPTNLGHRGRCTAQGMRENRLLRNLHDPRGQRQLRPAAAIGDAASVPPLVHVIQSRN
ncbi:hypothetical protein [Streptomyces sp. V1I1]|uniref:hypothetical protein n=1 Tax=Streptomyces sp. V1I1 TaxID=3042272 RepID=UPI002783BD8E|nr:hypothetical protein [Streptomyces sp. V1I1]MDQ0945738.1 hypothetical protein [Streptomyces sp. V1I1]